MTAALPDLSFHPAWHAQLELAYARAGDATRPVTRRHAGPLRVQKHLYAEGPEVCQHILVHPPGGIAGGDSLAFDVRLGERAWAQLTSPGAAKWYRAACPSRQTLEIHLEPGATLEWLPQESIVFAGAQAELETRIQLRGDARLFYWDMVALGRPASGERFASGHFVAALDIRRDDRLLWHERQRIDGGDRLLDSPIGLAGTRCWRPWSPAARSTPTCCNAAARPLRRPRQPQPVARRPAGGALPGRRGAARASLADRTLAPAAAGAARPRGRPPTHLEYLRWTCPPARKTSC